MAVTSARRGAGARIGAGWPLDGGGSPNRQHMEGLDGSPKAVGSWGPRIAADSGAMDPWPLHLGLPRGSDSSECRDADPSPSYLKWSQAVTSRNFYGML